MNLPLKNVGKVPLRSIFQDGRRRHLGKKIFTKSLRSELYLMFLGSENPFMTLF